MIRRKRTPFIVLYELTLRCNMRCVHCGSTAGESRTQELTTAEWNNVTKQLADLNCRDISLLGGEPFLNPDWYAIAQTITSYDMTVTIVTNGLCMNNEMK